MGALLNFVPPDVELRPADSGRTVEQGLSRPKPRACYVCHEIGPGPYYAYLWGRELRTYFTLPSAGHMMATNLHADTYEQARDQICDENGVPEAELRRVNLMFFLSVGGSGLTRRRRIETVWESDGERPHRRIFPPENDARGAAPGNLASPERLEQAHELVDRLVGNGQRTIEQTRAAVLETFA